MKGQIRIEFIFGVVIFAFVIFMIVSQVNTIFTSLGRDSMSDSSKAKAIGFIEMIVRDSGEPSDWENDPEAAERIGLAYNNQPFNLTLDKIEALNNVRTPFPDRRCTLLDNQDLGAYRLIIYKGNDVVLECGIQVVTPYLVTVSRPVFIEDEYGTISLEVW